MYPKDNIFNIYYNIGRRVPFQVKRSRNDDLRHSKEGKTFMVERVEPRGKYGEAYGYCLIDNVRNDEYMKEIYPDNKGEIPCAGCGEWTLVDVPGVDKKDIDISFNDDVLTVNVKYEKKNEKKNYTVKERFYSNTSRSFYLENANPEAIKAKLENGVLNIKVAKMPKVETKKLIAIE